MPVQTIPSITFPNVLRRGQFIDIKKGVSPQYDYIAGEFEASPDGRIVENEVCTFKQIIMNILSTPRGVYPIYDFSYGSDIHQLIGQHPDYVTTRLPNMVKEALVTNPRIASIDAVVTDILEESILFSVTAKDSLTGQRVRLEVAATA